MSAWEELASALDGQQRGVTRDLAHLFGDLWSALRAQADIAALLATIERTARVGGFTAADTAARLQHQALRPGVRQPVLLVDTCEQLALRRAVVIRERAQAVLTKATEALVSPYARLAAQILVTDAARTGATAGGLVGGATHKEFVRIRQVQEPRAHSRYEGTIRPLNGTWLIAGIEVDGPGDERLPWSEKAWCGHGLKYFRR